MCLPMQETWVRSLGQEDPLEREMANHSIILAWKIPGTEEPDRPPFMFIVLFCFFSTFEYFKSKKLGGNVRTA